MFYAVAFLLSDYPFSPSWVVTPAGWFVVEAWT